MLYTVAFGLSTKTFLVDLPGKRWKGHQWLSGGISITDTERAMLCECTSRCSYPDKVVVAAVLHHNRRDQLA